MAALTSRPPHRQRMALRYSLCMSSSAECRLRGVVKSATADGQEQALVSVNDLDHILSVDPKEYDLVQQRVLDTVHALQEHGVIQAFGKARLVPKRLYTLEELRLNKIDSTKLLSPREDTLQRMQRYLQIAAVAGLAAVTVTAQLDIGFVGAMALLSVFLLGCDQVAAGGGGSALLVDTFAQRFAPMYRERVVLHEAGHFLVAYLLGLMPMAYTLSSLQAFRQYGAVNVQAGCKFADQDFRAEVRNGQLSARQLDCFSCVALAGICAEYVQYGQAEGGMADLAQLDILLKVLQFSQKKADSELRWAILNTVSILRRHRNVLARLSVAMDRGASVAECVQLLEDDFRKCDDI